MSREADVEAPSSARDSRTQLRDRDTFYRDAPQLVDECRAQGTSLLLLCVDVEGIEFALRTFGPYERDELVRQVGQRLRDLDGADVGPYHISPGRFALVLRDSSHRKATRHAGRVVEALREPVELADVPYHLDVHVGISHFPNHADSLSEWVRASVFAAHQARSERIGYAIYDQNWDARDRKRFRLILELGHALDVGNQIRVAYQPILDVNTGRCVGVEALCRWQHPTEGLIPPGSFLPYVENTPLLLPLTETVIAQGLKDLRQLHDTGFDGHLAINLSPVLFQHPDLLDRLLQQFRFANMKLDRVHFEVTESGIMEQPNHGAHILGAIRERGSRISIDDFGTGHSSLAYLADLPIDTIKIDKHFVQNLAHPWGRAVVSAACTLAGTLGLTTVAEGIEKKRDYRRCQELGCDYAQGFYTGRPMFKGDFERWLAARPDR